MCVSCYNRDAEARRRKNAKGGLPHLCAILHTVDMVVQTAEAVEVFSVDLATGAGEIIVRRARCAEGALSFGWMAAGPGDIEVIYHE